MTEPTTGAASLRRTLVVPLAGVALLTGAALAAIAWESGSEAKRLQAQVSDVRHANGLVLQLLQLAGDADRHLLSFRFSPDDTLLTFIRDDDAQLDVIMADISRLDLPRRGAALWLAFVQAHGRQEQAERELIEASRAPRDGAVTLAFAKWQLTTDKASALLDDFSVYNVKRLDRAVARMQERRTRSLVLLSVVLAASVAVVIPFGLYVSRRVARPLLAMSSGADRVAREQVLVRFEGEERVDEIGTLARALNQMTGDLVRANEEQAAALRVRDEFISIASHELKTPLTALKLQLQVGARGLTAAGQAPPRWLQTAERQVGRLEALTGQLLDVTQLRAGRLTIEPRETNLSELVPAVAERFSVEAERSGAHLELDVAPGVTGHWDGDRLDQVLTNLVSNALKYGRGSRVAIRLEVRDGAARLSVRDEGPGIAEDAQARIFEPFERGAEARGVGGLGLGLYIVRQIVDAHGGEVTVESTPGKGATFAVVLPGAAVTPLALSVGPGTAS
jgi:signal transduction histidine kinase